MFRRRDIRLYREALLANRHRISRRSTVEPKEPLPTVAARLFRTLRHLINHAAFLSAIAGCSGGATKQ